jgi:hypothetical protein
MAIFNYPHLSLQKHPKKGSLALRFFSLVFGLLTLAGRSEAQYIIESNGSPSPVYNNPIDVALGVDELSDTLDIGFDFTFFGDTFSQFFISANGFISFAPEGGSGPVHQAIPDTDAPNNLIAMAWGSFEPDYIDVSYEVIGAAPYRRLHVNLFIEDYVEPPPCSSGYVLSGQMILYETTNIIELHTDYWDGGDCNMPATQGIENEDGTLAFAVSDRNDMLWTTTGSLVRFWPDDYTDLEVMALDPVLCEGLRDIRIQVKNVGLTTVDTFYVDWIWDGVPQDSVSVYTSLAPNGMTEVVMGQKTLVSGTNYPLEAWTYDPENEPDHYTLNDSITGSVKGGLEGIYTIGGTSPDFATISAAISALVTAGACDTVVFNIRTGTYSEELDIPFLTIAPDAVVIFQSETGNANDVTITRNYTSGTTNRMIEITNASHLRFKDLTLKVTGTVCSSVVYMTSYCADIQFTGCNIIGPTCNSTTTSGAVISMVNGQKNDIVIDSSLIRKGSYGVYISPGSSSFANDFVLHNNLIDSTYRYGAYLNRTDGYTVSGNNFFSPSTNIIGLEANTTYGRGLVDGNSFYFPQGVYGLRVFRYNYSVPVIDTLFVSNNMINLAGTFTGSRTLAIEQSNQVNVWHNTVHTTSSSATSYAFYSISNTLTNLKNNIITNYGTGGAAWLAAITSDYNVFDNITPPLISNGTNYSLLEDWVSASGQDQNSIQLNPQYESATDLHAHHGVLNGAGAALVPPVELDFDGESRNVSNPDIGADEFGFSNYDLTISELFFSEDLLSGDNDVQVAVFNIGLEEVDSFTLEWKINNDVQIPLEVNTPLSPGQGDTITVGTVNVEPGTPYTIRVNSTLAAPNPDDDPSNDTITIGPVYAKLNGPYTVGGVDPDFQLLSQAFQAAALGGIEDSIQFIVREGVYEDPINLSPSASFSCGKPVRVYSEDLDADAVVFNNDNQVQPVVRLNGVHGIHFSHMTFELTASAFHNTVIIENGASCNSFTSCEFTGRISTQTSTAYAVVLCNSNQGVDNDFYQNTFQSGSIGLSTNGPNLTTGSLVDIIGNTFINNYIQGLGVSNSRYVNIIGNHATITSVQHSQYNGMFANNCKSMVLSHNSVYNPFAVNGSGLGFTECDGTLQDTTRVYNNYVYSGQTNNLGSIFSGSYSDYTHISNNTSRSHQGRAASFSWCANFRADNNIFECIGTGPILELLNMQGSNIVSDNNCLYGKNVNIGEYNNTQYQTMAQWQALGFDVNSLNENPLFDDLSVHPHAVLLDGEAISYGHITDDYEGEERHPSTPDIGADEFDPLTADGGILAILHPRMPFPTGTNPVYVRFYNNSGDTLNELQFDWEVNGVAQPSFTWNGILTRGAVYDSLEIGQFDFEAFTPYQMKIWVSQPNGMPDQLAINDTLEIINQYAGLFGTYTVGGEDPDFETITNAVNALNAGGASGNVTFNIRNGTYPETILLNDFPGSDCDREVIFQSESGDSSLVTITNLGINAHTIVLNGADGVTFKDMTVKSVNTSFRHVVLFSGGAHCNRFEGNTFKGFQSTATANTSAVIRSTAGLDTANVFINNRLLDGSYSFHLTGNGGGITNTLISGNHLEPYYRGVYNSAIQGVTISYNTIIADNHSSGQGFEIYTGHNLKELSYNRIFVPLGQYGIAIDNCDNTTTNRGRIYNNFISVGGTGIARGIYLNGCAFQDIIHNSVLVYSTNGTLANTTPLYLTSNPNLRVLNNAVKNDGPGYAIYANSNTSFVADNNAYFTDGATFGYWNGGAVETTFANWQTACLQDTHSLNVDPTFMSTTDLHTFLVLLNEAGDPNTGISLDFDGELRDSLPDIGADEFDPLPSNDAGIFMFGGPHIPFAAGNHPVKFVMKNFGGNALTSATVRWTVNGIEQTPFDWTGNLPSAICDTFEIGTFMFDELVAYNIDAWTEMPNDTTDADPENDLLSTGTFYASLAGTYTVGGFAPDFNVVSELENILNLAGIVNHVTFEFRPGEYQEAITITDFPRTSYAHGVTFTSETGDSSDVILTQIANGTVLIDLDDAHKITFSHLTLTNTKSHTFQIRNGSSQITIANNRIESQEALSSSRSLIYSSTTTEDSLSILNNHFHNGYYGIYLYGGDFEKRHIITGNTFTGAYRTCLYLRKFDGLTCTGNLFQPLSTSHLDFYVYDGTGASTITRNRLYSDNSDLALYIGSITNTSSTSSLFANNFIYKSGTASNDVAVIENVAKINIDFNSIYNNRSHASSAALYTNNLSTHNIRNNIFYSIAGPAFHNNGTLPTVHNYNAIFSLGPIAAIQNSTNYATLAAYASGTSTNANSKGVDPLYVSEAGPEIAQYQLNSAGLTIAGLTTDINGTTRTSPPDIGADEFTPVMFDVKVSHAISPMDGCGLGTDEEVQLVLVNFGSAVATGFDVMMTLDGQTTTENIGALQVPPGDSLIYTFNETIDISGFQSYDLSFEIDFPGDVNSENDSIGHSFNNYPPLGDPASNLIPVNGTAGLENQVSLSWSPSDQAQTYDLYLWASTGSKPMTPTFAGLTSINKLVTDLTYGTTYFWQVHVVNICDEELPSDTATFTTRFLPDLIIESITVPPTGFSEQTIGIEWVTKNTGAGPTVPGTWYDNIYLSPDATYNSTDVLLGSIANLTSLNANQSYSHAANVVLPQGTNGTYYIIIKADHYNGVKETNNNNNTTYGTSTIDVTLSPPPDLIVTAITTPAITFSGELASLTFDVRNNGDGITTDPIWKDEVWLIPAAGNNNGITKLLSTRTHVGLLEPDSMYTSAGQNIIPANIYGLHHIQVKTDVKNDVYEFASEGNNQTLSDPFEIVLTPPVDLVPDSLVTPDTISLYQSNAYTYEVRNAGGSAPAVGWTDRIYLSPSPVYNSNFLIHAGYAYHNAGLMPGQEYDKTIQINITGNYEGTYYFYIVTDYNNKINEFNFEGNNIIRSAPFTIIKPDLRPDSLLHPESAMSGSALSVRAEIVNDGPGYYLSNLYTRYYLSDDNQLSTMNDWVLTSRIINNATIPAEDTLSSSFTLYLPANQFGNKYLLTQVDWAGYVHEGNEINNVLASPIELFESPHPDLFASSLHTPDTVTAGVPFTIDFQLSNQGDQRMAIAATDSIFLSFSPTWNRATAVPLATRTTATLDTGQQITYQVPIEINIAQNPNIYYIYIISDAKSSVYEGSGENNNILRSDAIIVEPYPEIDLELTSLSGLPDTLSSGQSYQMAYEVSNLSSVRTYYPAWTDRYYFSSDSIFQVGEDMYLGTLIYNSGILDSGETQLISAWLQTPNGISGDYYVFVETDSEDLNHDPDRTNNANTMRQLGAAKRIHVKLALYPDLEPTAFSCPVEIISGQYFQIGVTVTNSGPGVAGIRTDKIFVSTNNIIDQGDYTLKSINKNYLVSGSSQADSFSVFVPASYSGNYFILYSVDHGNAVYEYDEEQNNLLISTIEVTPPPPADLVVKNILVPDSLLAGNSDTIVWQTKNQGANPAYGQFREIVYLSPDTVWQVTDEVIGIWDGTIGLAPGATLTRSLVVPYNNVTNGDYHTLVRTDARNNVLESNEDNNDGFSFDLTNVDIEELFLNQSETAILVEGVNRYYKVLIEAEAAGRNVLVTLTGDSLLGVNQMYVKYEAVPTPADHDYAYSTPFFPHQRILIREAEPGYYYILINGFKTGDPTPQDVEIIARVIPMELIDITPKQGGNKGYTTIEAIGSELDSIVLVKLVRNDSTQAYYEIIADTFFMTDEGTRIFARFNLEGQPLAHYDFLCQRESIWMTKLERSFEIIDGRGPDLQVNWDFTPKSFNPRFTSIFQIKIDVENRGDSDALDRYIRVGAPAYDNPMYYTLQDYYNGLQHPQLVLSSEDQGGFPGILRPGGRRTFYVFGRIGGTQGFSITYDK